MIALDLDRARADAQPRMSWYTRSTGTPREAVAAEQLDRLRRTRTSRRGRRRLRHRGLERRRRTVRPGETTRLHQESGTLELRRHVGDFHCRPWRSDSGRLPDRALAHYRSRTRARPARHRRTSRRRRTFVIDVRDQRLEPSLLAAVAHTSTSSRSTRTPSNASSASLVPAQAHLHVWVPAMVTPGASRSTTTAPMPFVVPASLSGKRHHTRQTPATCARQSRSSCTR